MRGLFSLIAALPAVVLAVPSIDRRETAHTIPHSWILKFDQSGPMAALVGNLTELFGITPRHTYDFGGFKGAALDVHDSLIGLVSALPFVTHVERDAKVYASALVQQSSSTWGLARISRRAKGGSSYIYDNSAGSGTFAYVIDTGIYTGHSDFGGRATFGVNYADNSNTDGNGHGTHVAGTIGSTTYGVAKRTSLIAVKVLDANGEGSNSGVIAGINWAANDAKSKGRIGKAVANLSLGGEYSSTVNDAAASAVDAGLFMAVAAGNDNVNAQNSSPASEPSVCTVAASDINDNRASFSNYGSVVDIFGPGVNILSTWNNGGTKSISGTSMATPHIAGLAAYLLALEGSRTPAALCSRIQSLSTKNVISGPAGSPNYLAYNNNGY